MTVQNSEDERDDASAHFNKEQGSGAPEFLCGGAGYFGWQCLFSISQRDESLNTPY